MMILLFFLFSQEEKCRRCWLEVILCLYVVHRQMYVEKKEVNLKMTSFNHKILPNFSLLQEVYGMLDIKHVLQFYYDES